MTQPATTGNTPATATETVFDQILKSIVSGTYPPGARLPAERELSKQLGASRPTLREALRRLAEWRLVLARRGSGIEVRPMHEWSIEALPAYLRYGRPKHGEPGIPALLSDLLALRRSLMLAMVERVVGRTDTDGLDRAREFLTSAWEARSDGPKFAELDFAFMRAIVESAQFLPAAWLFNRLSGVYLDIARRVNAAIPPPKNYLPSNEALVDALEAGDGDKAMETLRDYLEGHDRRLLSSLGAKL